MSQGSFPDFAHLASFTYIDVIVFNDQITSRPLFHGLVHVAQMAVLGLDRYVDLYVRRFVKHRSWIAIPLEAQAFQLDARFAMSPADLILGGKGNKTLGRGGQLPVRTFLAGANHQIFLTCKTFFSVYSMHHQAVILWLKV